MRYMWKVYVCIFIYADVMVSKFMNKCPCKEECNGYLISLDMYMLPLINIVF